jgi:hypothetical protein
MNTNENDILQLQLNDTFYDWYLRTNQIIEYVNPINVYDVFPGVGLVESRSGNPGTVELSISTDSALYGIGTLNTGGIHDVVLTYATLTAATVTNTSLFAFQGGANQLFKVAASNILPPTVNGNHVFTGDITFEQDLNVFGPTITLNTNGASRDNCGIVVESTADTQIQNVLWTFDTATTAWMSSENLGLKTGKAFVTDSYPKAEFPFEASQSQGQVDLQLGTTSGGIPERFSIEAQFDTANSLSFSHYYNNILVNDILELSSSGGAGSGGEVIVKNTITITDVLNSTPFAQTPTATSVPITGSDGYLSQFVNRVTLPTGGTVTVGDFVYMNGSSARRASPDTLAESQSIGIVESISGGNAVIIMTGAFSGILNGLTAGDKYYLDPITPGRVTNLNPGNTNGDLDKLVFIATSATSGIIIPDFTTTGSGSITTTTSSSGTQDTFKTIEITGSSSVVADSPTDTLVFTAGDNITLTGNAGADTVTFASKIPQSATNHTLLFGKGVATYEYTTAINTFSIVGRAVDGNIAGIVIAPGTIVGRIDDSNDSDNAVKGLTGAEVRNIIGLPENSSYIQTVSFETGSGNPVLVHDATTDGELLTIAEGANISFTNVNGTLYISATGVSGETTQGGSSLFVGLEGPGETPVELNQLIFEDDYNGANTDSVKHISFEFRTTGTGIGFVSAKPTNNYLKLGADNKNSSHTAGNTLRIVGGTSITSNIAATTGFESITLNLDSTIYVQKIIASPAFTDSNGLILSGGDDNGRNTVKILDVTRPVAAFPLIGLNESTLIINAWDDVVDVNTVRKSTRLRGGLYATKCVSMFADSGYEDATTEGPSLYSYPIRMHELIVDKIICAELIATEATKQNEIISKIMGGVKDTQYISAAGSTKLEFITNADAYTSNGILFEFTDTASGNSSPNNAFILSPTQAYAESTEPDADYRQFVVGGRLRFADIVVDTAPFTNWSPTLSYNSSSSLLCESQLQTSAQFKFSASSAGTGTVGVQTNSTAGVNAYTYLTHTTDTGTTSHLRINALAEIQATSFTIKTATGGPGYKFAPVNTGQNIIAEGHVLYVDALTGLIGTIKSRFIIKPYIAGAGVDTTDPINTLYYTT